MIENLIPALEYLNYAIRASGPETRLKIVGGIETVYGGCCSRFMSDFDTVSINMAKPIVGIEYSKVEWTMWKTNVLFAF